MIESIENDQLTHVMNTYSTDLKKLAWRYVKDTSLVEDIVQEVFL
jgi:RNA polymerase sigma-70 factor, ECF subfamily